MLNAVKGWIQMSLADGRIEEYLPLTDIERAFQYLYINRIPLDSVDVNAPELTAFFEGKPQRILESYSAFMGVINSMHEDDSLLDDQFFLPGRNIAINRHPRYMPAISHSHGFFEIQYILTGSLTQTIDDISVTLHEGDLCFIAPNTSHRPFVADEGTQLINLLVRAGTLRSTFANSLTERDAISEFFLRVLSGQTYQPLLLCRTQRDGRVAHLIMEMLSEQDADDPYADKLLRSMMEQLFILLLRHHKNSFDLGRGLRKQDDTILSILRYIQNHYTDVSLSALAKHFNYTESHLSYLIHSYTGRTFSETVTDLRMQFVTSRLTGSEDSVAEIMEKAGYSDKTHFYRLFRRTYGMTPIQYRGEFSKS